MNEWQQVIWKGTAHEKKLSGWIKIEMSAILDDLFLFHAMQKWIQSWIIVEINATEKKEC